LDRKPDYAASFATPDSTHIDKNKIADNAIVDEILDIYSE